MSSDHPSSPAAPSGGGGHKPSSGGDSFPMGFFSVLCFVAFAIWFYYQMGGGNKVEYIDVVDHTMRINYSSEYGKEVTLDPHQDISFRNASTDYCVMNGAGIKFCASRGTDVGKQMPKSDANQKLRFASNENIDGHVDIYFWKKVEKK